MCDRRITAPYGLAGGANAATGCNTLLRAGEAAAVLPGKITFQARPGDRLIIETPGGGGWGHPPGDDR
jgi:N-methylhydantoinase B/oxoprolinase/acetone carboxylase alpha subunit